MDDTLCDRQPLVIGLRSDVRMHVVPTMRVWRHKRNDFTPWHYDGHGGDLLNVCVGGRKRFKPGRFFLGTHILI